MKNEIIVSLAMIVKDEEKCLERVLESAKNFVDEIIIVDTGSKDKTKEIARKYTSKVYDFEWVNDFAKARNFAFSKASGKYVMWLDADDYISEENLNKLLELKGKMTGEIDVYMLKYEIAFDNEGKSTFTYFRERILKNDGTFVWQGAVHEVIEPHGKIENVDIAIKHLKEDENEPKRNLKIYQELIKKGHELSPREQYYFARELYYNGKFKSAITQINKFIKGGKGWKENVLGALEIKAFCQIALKRRDLALKTLYQSFNYDEPRANFLCLIGDIFLEQNKYKEAIFFYKNALTCEKNYSSGAFIVEDYYGYYPALQLCVCYYRLGEIEKAMSCNNFALSIKPNDETALKNDIFFKSLT